MSYLVFCTFDLKNASRQDYEAAYVDLKKLGLSKVVVSSKASEVVIPTTSVLGEFNGESASKVRDELRDRIQAAFRTRKFKSEIFVVVGGNWAWGAATT
jgi:hypothetical protein